MGKRSIGRILLWEALMSAALSLLGGLALGVLLSKLCELLLVNLLRGSVTFTFTISVSRYPRYGAAVRRDFRADGAL